MNMRGWRVSGVKNQPRSPADSFPRMMRSFLCTATDTNFHRGHRQTLQGFLSCRTLRTVRCTNSQPQILNRRCAKGAPIGDSRLEAHAPGNPKARDDAPLDLVASL